MVAMGVGIVASAGLRRRRERLGATVAIMAVGLGLDPDVINDIENGKGPTQARAHYLKWLSVLERLPADKLRTELFLAIQGRRFRP